MTPTNAIFACLESCADMMGKKKCKISNVVSVIILEDTSLWLQVLTLSLPFNTA